MTEVEKDSNAALLVDPVCGEQFHEQEAVASFEHCGRTYSFKHIKCKMLFEKEPDRYLNSDGTPSITPLAAPTTPRKFRIGLDTEPRSQIGMITGIADAAANRASASSAPA